MFDLILRGGRVLDGAGNVDVLADVAVEDGRIAAVGRLTSAEARESVDVSGLTICPGFVDVHCHSDALPFASDPLPAKILQGVTTEVNGDCGSPHLSNHVNDRTAYRGIGRARDHSGSEARQSGRLPLQARGSGSLSGEPSR